MSDARDRAAARLAEELGLRVESPSIVSVPGDRLKDINIGMVFSKLWNALLDREVALEEADGMAMRVDKMHDSGFWVEGVDSESFHRKDAVALRLALARYRAARGRKA
jgi:hypothetical protein